MLNLGIGHLGRTLAAAFVAAMLLALTPIAQAQQTAPAPEMSSVELQKLVQTLEDPEDRGRLIAELKALQQAQQKAEGAMEEPGLGALLLSTLSDNIRQASDMLTTVTAALLNPA
ncbi:MAG TPA: hypothetical protein VH835_14665, partial [Dongiaceae bacterium]